MRATGSTKRSADVVIQELAARQHGVVTRAQLQAAGVGRRAVDRRISKGLLRPLHHGVFQVGRIATPGMRELAACLACGPTATVADRSAAALWQLLAASEPAEPVEILVCGGERRHAGVRVRRVARMEDDDRTELNGIPVTTPARTLCDLASLVSLGELERALARALASRLTTRAQLDTVLLRVSGRRGAGRLRALIAGNGPALTRSEAEERLLALVRKAGLPEPEANVRIAGCEVDLLWRDQRLVAEVDGYAFHADAVAFENDRRRDLVLVSQGMRVVRVTWRQLTREPETVLVRLAQALVHP